MVGKVPARLARSTRTRVSKSQLPHRRATVQIVKASNPNDEPDLDPESPDFFGSEDWDGNEGPFIRPEGSPFFATYTDPTVWTFSRSWRRC